MLKNDQTNFKNLAVFYRTIFKVWLTIFDIMHEWFSGILCSDTMSQIKSFSRECFLRHYGGQLKTVIKQEAVEKIE